MRLVLLSVIAALPVLAACGTTGGKSEYQRDFDRLNAGCVERQGILIPTGVQSGRPETEYACRITGGVSRILAD